MKRICLSAILDCMLQASVEAQPATTNASTARVAATIIARSASSRTWARITKQTNASGQITLVTNKAYVEVSPGICHTNSSGEWVDSSEDIDIVADGAASTNAAHTVHFAGNVNAAGGTVHLVAPDKKVFDSRVYGLAYSDTVSGSNVLLAPLQDAQGVIVGTNIVLFTNAFKWLNADIEYIVTKAGLEQNIILREQVPDPASFGDGFNPKTTRLQVLTEFLSPPAPQKRTQVVNAIEDDILLNFGTMSIGPGKAFYTKAPGQGQPTALKSSRVVKHWTQMSGRQLLIEEVPYLAISNAVQNLPIHAGITNSSAISIKHTAALEPLLPANLPGNAKPGPMQLAKSLPQQPGLVIDYSLLSGETEVYDFTAGTWLIWGHVGIYPTDPTVSTTFEAGAVLKFSDDPETMLFAQGATTSIFNSTPTSPVIFTSIDDDTCGEVIDGSQGGPTSSGSPAQGMGAYLFEMGGNGDSPLVTVANAIFSYAGIAYNDTDATSPIFSRTASLRIAAPTWSSVAPAWIARISCLRDAAASWPLPAPRVRWRRNVLRWIHLLSSRCRKITIMAGVQ